MTRIWREATFFSSILHFQFIIVHFVSVPACSSPEPLYDIVIFIGPTRPFPDPFPFLYAVEKELRQKEAGPQLQAAMRAWQSRPALERLRWAIELVRQPEQ